MSNTSRALHIDDVQWQDDLALFRSMDGRVPWKERFGQGRVKVLHFDLKTQASAYIFDWPAGYDPLGEHGHGGNCSELLLTGSLIEGDHTWGPGSFFYTGSGQRHGPLRAGPEGCTLLVQVDGPLFDDEFMHGLTAQGKAERRRV